MRSNGSKKKIAPGGEEFKKQNEQLELLKQRIAEMVKNDPAISLDKVKGLFSEFATIYDAMHICINGFYLPHLQNADSDPEEAEGVDGSHAKPSRATAFLTMFKS